MLAAFVLIQIPFFLRTRTKPLRAEDTQVFKINDAVTIKVSVVITSNFAGPFPFVGKDSIVKEVDYPVEIIVGTGRALSRVGEEYK